MKRPEHGTHEQIAHIGLGSNLGDRAAMLRSAVAVIDDLAKVRVVPGGVASLYETDPVGGPGDQPMFLNSALRISTTLDPASLLAAILAVETGLGRVRGPRWSARLIDIDLLLFGDVVLQSDRLTIPHPRLHERLFVLAPLAEIAADVIHPVIGASIETLAQRARGTAGSSSVRRIAGPVCHCS